MEPVEPERRRQVPALLWYIMAALVAVVFAAFVMVLGRPADIGIGDNADPAAAARQPPIAPPDTGIVVN